MTTNQLKAQQGTRSPNVRPSTALVANRHDCICVKIVQSANKLLDIHLAPPFCIAAPQMCKAKNYNKIIP